MLILMDFNTWWTAKEGFEQAFWVVALPSSMFFLIMLIMTFFGGEVGAEHVEFDADAGDIDDVGDDGGIGFQFFTLKNLVAFFTIFSWTGIACIQQGLNVYATIGIALISGLLIMVVMATLFYFISKLSDSGTLQLENAIGVVGEVYLTIKPARSGVGKVQLTVQGGLRTLDAMTDDDEELPSGSLAKVTRIINDQLLLVTKP